MKIISIFLSVTFLISVLSFSTLSAQNNLLGKIDFPNSGSNAAQADFLDGVKFLHNFEYDDAARAFQRAIDIDPDFAMAYYGLAKSHNHPIWKQQDRVAAMAVLSQLGETMQERQMAAPTEREKDLLMSLEILYGNTEASQDLSKELRDDLYMEFMADLHDRYPEDHEITSFYGLSILGTAHEGRDFSIYMKAAAELMDVWNANPEHPGAAHYLIHSFDDPVHAPLGLPMAKAYSEIAPSAAHAQHMTSHIFLALGMWDDVVDANIVARNVQTTRQKELGEQPTVCGHYTWWLQYGYLQGGEVMEASSVLDKCYERINTIKEAEEEWSEKWHFATMRGHQIVDTKNWGDIEKWTDDYEPGSRASINYFFTNAYAAVNMGEADKAREHLNKLMEAPESPDLNIQINQIKSLLLIAGGSTEEGLELLNETSIVESEQPVDFGPPTIVKPSYELLGDVYLDLGRYEEALAAYEKQLDRTPKRRNSVMSKQRAVELLSSN